MRRRLYTGWRDIWFNVIGGAAAICGFFTLYEIIVSTKQTETLRVALVLWSTLPPVWFWVEYHFFYRSEPQQDQGGWEQWKYHQELAKAIWLAAVAMIGALFFKGI